MNDIIIVGAGPSGLCAAKTFLQHDPAADLVILDARSTIGGVWSREQLLPTLRTNNLWGSIDFTDVPMDESFGIRPGQHVTGEAMHRYLGAYADRFDLAGRIRLETRVVEVRRREGRGGARGGDGPGWSVRTEDASPSGGARPGAVLECRRLVVATGILSVPQMPSLGGGAGAFGAPLLHFSDLGGRGGAAVLSDPDVRRVAVLGGGKSAYDAVYLAATTGHRVEWIIRRSGRGPAWVAPAHTRIGPFRAWREMLTVRRIVSFMSPWALPDYSGMGWLRRFLHHNVVGKKISQAFWGALHRGTTRDCKYKVDKDIAILQPENNPLWSDLYPLITHPPPSPSLSHTHPFLLPSALSPQAAGWHDRLTAHAGMGRKPGS